MLNKALKSEADNRRVEANKKRKAVAFQNKQQGGPRFKNVTPQTWRPMYLAPQPRPIAPAPTAAAARPQTSEVRTPAPTIPAPGQGPSNLNYYQCGEKGHFTRACPKRQVAPVRFPARTTPVRAATTPAAPRAV
ncbi:hypothetical protein E2562_019570 [Oryza meyeriana var. granulata]|uniref:CCHC-type domain-containing protein n=1 Tax=Oryza meyeriana var. granulata TaxID=110450 RepID=A0A6G1BZ35_9ORYZ|nr:hypothetical protein E2562_019570 [Oryza meyeriana var. granulata]